MHSNKDSAMLQTPIDAATASFHEDTPLEIPLKTMLLDAIDGVGVPTLGIGMEAERHFLARVESSQHNHKFVWCRDKLDKLPEAQLQSLYYNLKVAQNAC